MENTILVLKTYVDGGIGDTPFPNTEGDPIEIGAFRYDAKRMGGAPIITASVNYPSCLDDEWTDKVHAEFRGEKYYLKQTPTSSYDNEESLYKHDIELVSERAILDNVYFFDAVVGNPQGEDKPVSNSTKVVFFGGIKEFARRMNASLEYSKLLKWEDGVDDEGNPIKVANGYNIVVDNDEAITTEEKLMSFEDQFFSNVLQEIYNVFQVPYYFVGKTIHIGFASNLENPPTFAYGVDDALLSITKNNANFKVVNRVTGTGSSDNIPFYYPNQAPKGDIELHTTGTLSPEDIKIEDVVKFNSLNINKTYTFHGDTSLNTISSEAVVPSSSTIVPFDKNKATIERLYFNNDGIDVNIRYNLFLDSYANGEIEINWSLVDIPNISFNVDSKAATNASKQLELEIRNISLFNNDNDEELPFEPITEKLTYYSVLHYVPNSAPTGILDSKLRQVGVRFSLPSIKDSATILVSARLKTLGNFWDFVSNYRDYLWNKGPCSGISFTSKVVTHTTGGWRDEDNNFYNMRNYGISFLKEPQYNDTFKYTIIKYVNTSENLMPLVYRHSDGKERFYNAIKYPYPKYEGFDDTLINGYYGDDGILRNPYGEYEIEGYIHNDAYKGEDGSYIDFKNPFVEGHPKEHIIAVEDIKPTIKDVKVLQPEGSTFAGFTLNSDMFTEFAYDRDDNDETEEGDNESSRDFKHSYFFGKLRVLDFNLFDHAIENQPMTISFTSGDCGACNFTIGVTEEFPQKNPVQVDDDGNLIYDEKTGNVVCTNVTRFQERQQDTSKYEVWIALKKEEETYGILMPKAPKFDEDGEQIEAPHRPKACTINEDGTPNNDGDTFVILGINLPNSYIVNAEKKLEKEIIKYLKENNEEKFTFSIGFSRIYFEEHPSMLQYLNENSRFYVTYNNKNYLLYVTSYSYQMSEGDILPQIAVELDENLTVSQNALQNAINEVRSEVGAALSNIDVLAIASPFFIRKDINDVVNGTPNFVKGLKFGEGGKVEVMDNNSAKLTIEYLEVTKKASFTSLEIKEKTHVGGQIVISPAAMTCGEVEEVVDAYRCYFQTKGENDTDEIFNQFAINDLAICQTYNAWGSRYYWRKVVGVGDDYIDLSKTLCDEGSDIPMAGDKIIQLGNTEDITRQAAQVLSAYGDDAPSFIMYNGINDFTLVDKNITGIIWNPKTQEPQLYSYGSFFFGDGTTDENGNLVGDSYITYQKKDGENKKGLYINANVTLGSESTGLSNLEEWKDVQDSVTQVKDDTAFLKATFDKAVDVDGVVMSKIVAVKNEEGYVESILNGSETFKDNTSDHGKIILAAGIGDGEADSLPIRTNNASTRIYEDGTIHSSAIHLHSGCTIGDDIKLGDANGVGYIAIGDILSSNEGGLRISEGSLLLTNKSSKGNTQSIDLGGCAGYAMSIGVGVGLHCSPHPKDVGLEIDAPNEWAHCVPRGVFAGLRSKTRVISTSAASGTSSSPVYLDNFDYNVLITRTSGTVYLRLPETPLDGQEYWVETFGADISMSSSTRMWSHVNGAYETSHAFASRGVIRFKYYAEASAWTYTWVESR